MTVAGPRRSFLADCDGYQHGHHEEDDTAGEDDADHGQCLDRGGQPGPGDGGVAERAERADGSADRTADRTAEEEQTDREEGELTPAQADEGSSFPGGISDAQLAIGDGGLNESPGVSGTFGRMRRRTRTCPGMPL
ncbi:hypothetical protein ACFVUN_14625 [Kitasatospora griseola]|uniref:hypothetical protein n=1 Tax=Kitasatospora griseola TaxID=2064 RepID=UPI0036D7B01E